MHALNQESGPFYTSHVPAGGRQGGTRQEAALPGWERPGKHKNSGNEAKESLKTKDIAFLNAANHGRLACKLAPIKP